MVTRLGLSLAKWKIYICTALRRTYYNTTTTTRLVIRTEETNCRFPCKPDSLLFT